MYKIEIENNVTHQKYTYDNVEDKNNGKKLFYNFNLDTSNLDDGEYTLSLYDGNNLITSELLKIGDFNNKTIQYSKGSNVYIDAKPTKIDVANEGIKLGNSTFTEIPVVFDFSNVTDMYGMFHSCSNLKTIPLIDTSNVTNMESMFSGCSKLTTIPQLNTSNATRMDYMFYNCTKLQSIPLLECGNVTNMSHMFYNCTKLQSIPLIDTSNVTNMFRMFFHCRSLQSIPLLDTSNVTDMQLMFYNCSTLQSIPLLDTSNVTIMSSMFSNCSSLQSIPLLDCSKVKYMSSMFGSSDNTTLTEIGGFKNLKISVTSNFLDKAPNLTVDSLMNVINYLYDLTSNGLSGQSLNFGQTNLDKLSAEQIAVATAKGWTLIA